MKFIDKLLDFVSSKKIIRTSRHHHIAVVFQYHNNKTAEILAHATNVTYQEHLMIHAELNALQKLKRHPGARPQEINLLVIRLANGALTNSKPCFHCIKRMAVFTKRLNYKLNYIFYSISHSTIEYSRHITNDHCSKYHQRKASGTLQ